MSIYKKLSTYDVASVPFNANKQYSFVSSSASALNITLEKAEFTSASLHTYSSASTDTSSSIKYHQLNHLFYKNFQTDLNNRFGNVHYLDQQRTLYDKLNVISIPSSLYGLEIKPGSFYLSSSCYEVIDDKKGNLIISGSNLDNHSTDIRKKLFHLGPVEGFKHYDLNSPFYFYRKKIDPNRTRLYYSKEKVGDDSYYSNHLTYKNIEFIEKNQGGELTTNSEFTDLTLTGTKKISGWSHNGYSGSLNSQAEADLLPGRISLTASGSGNSMSQISTIDAVMTAGKQYEVIVDVHSFTSVNPATAQFSINLGSPYPKVLPVNTAGTSYEDAKGIYRKVFYARGAEWFNNSSKLHLYIWNQGTNDTNIIINSIKLREYIPMPAADFIGTADISSSIVSPHDDKFNFNPGDDFTISMYIDPKKEGHILSKSTTKTIIPTPMNSRYGQVPLKLSGSHQPREVLAEPQYPFEVLIQNNDAIGIGQLQIGSWTIGDSYQKEDLLIFRKSDGTNTPQATAVIESGSVGYHVTCMCSASKMSVWIDGEERVSTTDTTVKQTQNKTNLYIGSQGEQHNYYSGSIANLMIFNGAKTSDQISNLSLDINSSPYVGNIFYSQGIATITHPRYQTIASASNDDYTLKFKGSHFIYENEYQCTVRADEYNFTHNTSTRKIRSKEYPTLADFTTGSVWKPYVTTIGLYDENNELLVVGKLGQPIRMSDETDTTFILRWDT